MVMRSETSLVQFTGKEELDARQHSARWMLKLLDCGCAIDDDFIYCAGWVCGGLPKMLAAMERELVLPAARTREASAIRQEWREVSASEEHRIDDMLESFYRHTPSMRKQIQAILRHRLEEQASACRNVAQISFLRRLEKLFGLGAKALNVCFFAFVLSQYRPAERFFEDSLELPSPAKRHLFGALFGIAGGEVYLLRQELEKMGLFETRHNSFRLTDNVEAVLLADTDKNLLDFFCAELPKPTVAIEQFYMAESDRDMALKLLGSASKNPVHLLLYGSPGSGKTSFAAALAGQLGVKAWAAKCGEKDDTEDRRASLTACLKLAEKHPGAFVLVDEAERILDTHATDLTQGSAKAWLNDLLERPNTRIIWITNQVGHLDNAVRRRFSYSIFFDEPGKKERLQMWESVAARHHVKKQLSKETLERFAEQYELPIATMDKAIRQAKPIAAKGELAIFVERMLKSQVALRYDGVPPLARPKSKAWYDPDAICAKTSIDEFIGKAAKLVKNMEENPIPGMGSMLFYGPPGTGKTALARHLAELNNRELMVCRASDLQSMFVGETEKNIARAFYQAEAKGRLLLIDEVDSFVFSREGAERSWERSMVNEFLTSLENFRGLCVCTTNNRGELDPAAMRRFSIKLEFDYARPEQLAKLYANILATLVQQPASKAIMDRLLACKHLAPGDFAAVRLALWLEDGLTHERLLNALLAEERLKLEKEAKTLGF